MDFFDLPADLQVTPHLDLWHHLHLTQGDDWIFTVKDLHQPPGSFDLTYQWARAGVTSFSLTATSDDAGDYSFNVPAATTTAYTPGAYRVAAILTDTATGTRHTLGIQEGLLLPNLATVADPRSPNRIALDAVEAALAGAAPGAHICEYQVGGKIFKRKIEELVRMRAYYLQRTRIEDGKYMSHIYYNL